MSGRPTPDPEIFAQFVPKIRHGCDAVINITTGGGQGMSLEERSAAGYARLPPTFPVMSGVRSSSPCVSSKVLQIAE